MPEIWRFAPASPNIIISPPITIATSASARATGPVNVRAKLFAARSHGDCASATAGTTSTEIVRTTSRAVDGAGLLRMTASLQQVTPDLSYEQTYVNNHTAR